MEIVPLPTKPKAPDDLYDRLIELAEGVKEGKVTRLVCAYCNEESHEALIACSPNQAAGLLTVLTIVIQDRFKGNHG